MLKKFIVSAVLPVFMFMLALPVSAEEIIPDVPSVAPDLGQEANIITALIGQQSAKAGEEIMVDVKWFPVGEYRVSSSEGKDAKPLSANISITDGAGNFCADPVWKTVFSEYQDFTVSIIANRDCGQLHARIALIDADKKLLDAVDITSDEKAIIKPEVKAQEMQSSDEQGLLGNVSPTLRLAIIAVGIITLVGLIAILGRNALRRRSVMTMLLPILLALPLLMSGEEAKGVTWGPGGFTVTTNKSTYAPGETILLSGESVSTNIMCTNDISAEGSGASYAFSPVAISASMGGNSVTILSAQPSFNSTVIVNGSLYARVSGTASLIAPSTSGTYTINLTGTVYSLAGQCNWGTYPVTNAPASIVITVSAPAIPGICGTANGGSFSTAPSSSLCVTGTASWTDNTAADNIFNWNCVGSNGGITTSCMANKTTATPAATCGTADGGTFASAPTSNLCSKGTASAVYDYGYWSWTCSPTLCYTVLTAYNGYVTMCMVSGPYMIPVSCAANKGTAVAAPTVTFWADSTSVVSGGSTTLRWTSANATSCTASGGWSGAKAANGTESTGALTVNQTYNLSCTGPGGTSPVYTVSIGVTPPSTLKACLNSCNSGSSDFNGQTISLAPGDTRRLAVCYNSASGCSSALGDITASATTTFAANNTPSDAVTPTATKGEFSANSVPATRTESVSITTASGNASVAFSVTPICASSCSAEEKDHCTGESFQTKDSCGTTETCTGTRYCDFNWKEVAP